MVSVLVKYDGYMCSHNQTIFTIVVLALKLCSGHSSKNYGTICMLVLIISSRTVQHVEPQHEYTFPEIEPGAHKRKGKEPQTHSIAVFYLLLNAKFTQSPYKESFYKLNIFSCIERG